MGTQGEGDGAATAGGPDAKKDDIYENRPGSKKIIRVVTVMAYMVSVSFVAIVLSAYYVFLWQPPNPRLMHHSHLRADPQVEYLVHRPPTEVSLDETLSDIDIRDKVNVFREEIIRNRGVNVTIVESQQEILPEKFKNLNVSRRNSSNSKDETIRNNSRISTSVWNPIVRALLGTTEIPTSQETRDSTGVYESVNIARKSSLDTKSLEASTLFMATRKINGSTILESSSSESLTEGRDKLYNASMNDFTWNAAFTEMNIESSESIRSLNNSSEKLGNTSERDFGELMPTRAYETLENSTNTEVDQLPISVLEETTIRTLGTSGGSSPAEIQSETVRTTASLAKQSSEWRALEFTIRPRKLASHVTKLPKKSLTNETEPLEKFPSSLQANEEIPIEILPGPTEDVSPVSKSPASAMPAVVQPKSKFKENDQESKEQLTQDGDFGFI